MPSLLAFAAPFALIVPLLSQFGSERAVDAATAAGVAQPGHSTSAGQPGPDYELPAEGPYSRAQPIRRPLDALHGVQIANQVRIDRRVIIRISPRRPANRNSLLAQLPQQPLASRLIERDMERCLPVNRISGVQTGMGNRLLLFLNDQRIVSVKLERACRAREFYSGFYVESTEDGRLCAERDLLQSRSGAKCEVEHMRQLVAVDD